MTTYGELARTVDQKTATSQELYVEESRRKKVEWDGETVKSVESERDSGASLRVFEDNRIGFSYANKEELDPDWLVEQSKRTQSLLPEDEHHALSDADPDEETVDEWYDSTIEESASERVEGVTERIRHYLEAEDEVKNLQVTFSESEDHSHLYRDTQCLAEERRTSFSISTWAVCDDGEDVQSGFERQGTFGYSHLDVDGVISRAITKGKQKLGATPPDSRTGPAVLDAQAASGLLRLLKQMTDGEAVVKGRSAWGQEKLGETIADESVTLVDDPSRETGAANRRYDAEGHRMGPVAVVEDGVYRAFLTNQYVASRTGRENNHRAARQYSSRPSVGTTNFCLSPGETSFGAMKEKLGDGPVITGIQPASGLDSVAGHFSVGCSGYFVKNGSMAQPFDEATISGDIEDFLTNLEAIGTSLPPGYSVASPALMVSELSLGGN